MNLVCVGISHHTAPLPERERLWFSEDEIRRTLPLCTSAGCSEAVLFSTCNRTELYALIPDALETPHILSTIIRTQKKALESVPEEHLFVHSGAAAVDHLFRVAGGIDSMVLGDVQILMQVKDGYSLAVETGNAGFFMNRLFQLALRVGKRARAETQIGDGAVSVSYAAVELAERIFENLRTKTALVIGAGETAELTAKHLRGKEIGQLLITNRTQERAESLARSVQGTAIPFETWNEILPSVDIVISSVDVHRYVLRASDVRSVVRRRLAGPLFIIDIGVPRNIDPEIRALENVFLYDVDNLQQMVAENIRKRQDQVPHVERIVNNVQDEFSQWVDSLEVNPTIGALTALLESIRSEEVSKNINRFDPKDREILDLVTKRIVNKILHMPLVTLRNGQKHSPSERLHRMHAIRELFGIGKSSETKTDE